MINSEQLNFASVLSAYIQDSFRPFAQLNLPSQAVPGTFVRQVISNNSQAGLLKNYDIYHYNKGKALSLFSIHRYNKLQSQCNYHICFPREGNIKQLNMGLELQGP